MKKKPVNFDLKESSASCRKVWKAYPRALHVFSFRLRVCLRKDKFNSLTSHNPKSILGRRKLISSLNPIKFPPDFRVFMLLSFIGRYQVPQVVDVWELISLVKYHLAFLVFNLCCYPFKWLTTSSPAAGALMCIRLPAWSCCAASSSTTRSSTCYGGITTTALRLSYTASWRRAPATPSSTCTISAPS